MTLFSRGSGESAAPPPRQEKIDWTNFLANTVWLNKQIKIDKRTMFYPEWFNRGVKFVNDFVNDDGSFLTVFKQIWILCKFFAI